MSVKLTGGAARERNHYFNISWNTYSVSGSDFRSYSYKALPGKKLQQNLSNGFIPLASVADLLDVNTMAISNFMKTFQFYSLLMTMDDSISPIGYVYLIIFDNKFKIGKTSNFTNRYNKETRDKAIFIIPVSNDNLVEKELIAKYRSEGYVNVQGREYFKLDSKNRVETIFKDVTDKYKVDYDTRRSQYIARLKLTSEKKFKTYVHPCICKIFSNRYAPDDDHRKKYNNFFKLVGKQISNGYFDEIYDNMNKSICSYWLYFNYVGIRRWSDNKVNISRLFNSIKKHTKKHTKRPLSEFADLITRNKRLSKSFKAKYPSRTMIELCDNKEQPYLSGYYLDITLVPTFVGWASTDALLDMNELLLHIGSDAFAESSINEVKTRISIQRYLSLNRLIFDDLNYGLM